MTLFVPDIVLRLLDLHGVDRSALARDMEKSFEGRMRTRDWMDSGQAPRHVLSTIPSGFPKFKAKIANDMLCIEAMRLGQETIFKAGKRSASISIPAKGIPLTLIASFAGRRLNEIVGDEAVDPHSVVVSAASVKENGHDRVRLNLKMMQSELEAPATLPAKRLIVTEPVNVVEIVRLTGRRAIDAPRVPVRDVARSHWWPRAVQEAYAIAVLPSRSTNPPAEAIDLVFPYEAGLVSDVGQSGLGGRYERGDRVWRFDATHTAVAGMPRFLATLPVPLITPDGTIWIKEDTGNA